MGGDLSRPQQAVLDAIVALSAERDYPPTVRELGERVGLASTSTVHSHLRSLVRSGHIEYDPAKPRTIKVTGAAPPALLSQSVECLRDLATLYDDPEVRTDPYRFSCRLDGLVSHARKVVARFDQEAGPPPHLASALTSALEPTQGEPK